MGSERLSDSKTGRRHHPFRPEGDNATPLTPAASTAAAVSSQLPLLNTLG